MLSPNPDLLFEYAGYQMITHISLKTLAKVIQDGSQFFSSFLSTHKTFGAISHALRNIHLENYKRKTLNFDYCVDLNLNIMLLLITKKHLHKVIFVKQNGAQAYTIKH